jgi:hypothetical protein
VNKELLEELNEAELAERVLASKQLQVDAMELTDHCQAGAGPGNHGCLR